MSLPKNHCLQEREYSGWQLITLYWRSKHRWSAYAFTFVIMLLTVIMVAFDVILSYWFNYFYNALQAYDVRATLRLMGFFCVLATFFIIVQVYRYYVSQLFALRWRRFLTEQLIERWIRKRGYYYLENFDVKTDNPDQRIQEDAGALVTNSIDLTVGLVGAVVTIFSYIYVLWTLSGDLVIPLGSWGTFHIKGYLVWAGLIYNFIGTLIIFKIGRPLVALNFEQQRREATFRYTAIDLRSHAEEIALYHGEHHQKGVLDFHFRRVLQNWYAIILRQKKLIWFTGGFNQAAVLLPFVAAMPHYFNKVFQLGGLMQSVRSFNSVQDSLSYLINSFTQIAQWRAIVQRLTTFLNHLYESEVAAKDANTITVKKEKDNTIATKNLTIKTAQGKILLENIAETFVHGEGYVIKGESGIGKSTFIRTLAGIWPYAAGEICFPSNKSIMYLPQKPYMPIGTLADAIVFPAKADKSLEKHLKTVLQDCRLAAFIPRLNETADWSTTLSPGEQQRIGFARILLHKPDWVFLDESTSMLDLKNEKHLYNLLRERLPKCTVVSVGHRPSLDAFHQHVVTMEKYQPATV